MPVVLVPHAEQRMLLRGATRDEIIACIESGKRFPAKHGRSGFRRNFGGHFNWRGKPFDKKQIEAYAVHEGDNWIVITVIVKFF
jgi:hypothetical protein